MSRNSIRHWISNKLRRASSSRPVKERSFKLRLKALEPREVPSAVTSVVDLADPQRHVWDFATVLGQFGANLFGRDATGHWFGIANNPLDKIRAGNDLTGRPMLAYEDTFTAADATYFFGFQLTSPLIYSRFKVWTADHGSQEISLAPKGSPVDWQAGRNGSIIVRFSDGAVDLIQETSNPSNPTELPTFSETNIWSGGATGASIGTDANGATVVDIVSSHQLFEFSQATGKIKTLEVPGVWKKFSAAEGGSSFVVQPNSSGGNDILLYSDQTQQLTDVGIKDVNIKTLQFSMDGVVFGIGDNLKLEMFDLSRFDPANPQSAQPFFALTTSGMVVGKNDDPNMKIMRHPGNPSEGFTPAVFENRRSPSDQKRDQIFQFDPTNKAWEPIGQIDPNIGIGVLVGQAVAPLVGDSSSPEPPLPSFMAPTPNLPQDLVFNLDQGATTNDAITVSTVTSSNGSVGVWVGLNGTNSTFYAGPISSITINAGSGDDTITVERLDANIPLTINLGSGNDTIRFSSIAHQMDDIKSGVIINRGTGTSTVVVDDDRTADVSAGTQMLHNNVTYSISSGDLWRLNQLGTAFDPSGSSTNLHIQFAGVTNLVVNGGQSGTTFNVFGVADGTALTVVGGDGHDRLNFDDTGNSFSNGAAYTVTASNVTRVGAGAASSSGVSTSLPRFTASIDYANIEDLEVQAGPSGNAIDVLDTNPDTATTIDAGNASDTIAVSDGAQTLGGIRGPLLINGNATTTLNLDDRGNGNNNNYWLTGYSLSRTYTGPVFFSGMGRVHIYGGSGEERYHVGTMMNGPVPAPAWITPNSSIDLYTTGTQDNRVSVTDAVYADANNVLQFTLDGLSGLSVHGHSADSVIVDNTANMPLPAGTTLTGQDLAVTADGVTMAYSGQSSAGNSTILFAAATSVAYDGVGTLEVDGGPTSNEIDVRSTAAATPVWIYAGSGAASINVGLGSVQNISGDLYIDKPAGTGSITVDDSKNPAYARNVSVDNFTPSGLSATSYGRIRGLAPGAIDYTLSGAASDVTIRGGGSVPGAGGTSGMPGTPGNAGNTYTVTGGAASVQTISLYAGPGYDVINVGSPDAAGSLAGYHGRLIVNGQGKTALAVNDQGATTYRTYTLADGSIGWGDYGVPAAPPQLIYSGIANLRFDGGIGGYSVFNVPSTTPGTTTRLYGHGSDNMFYVGSMDLNGIRGTLDVHGSPTSVYNYLTFFDNYNTAPHIYTWNTGRLERADKSTGQPDLNPITYDTISTLTLNTSFYGGNVTYVQSTGSAASPMIVAGPGDSVVVGRMVDPTNPARGRTLADIQGQVNILGYYTNTTFQTLVDDSGDTSAHPNVLFNNDGFEYGMSGLAPAKIYFRLSPTSSVNVLAGSGGNSFQVRDLDTLPGTLHIGGGGSDSLAVSDQNATSDRSYALADGSIGWSNGSGAAPASSPLTYNGIASLRFDSGSGIRNSVFVYSTTPGATTSLYGHGTIDMFYAGLSTLNGIQGALQVHGSSYSTYLFLYDYLNPVGQVYTWNTGKLERAAATAPNTPNMQPITWDGVTSLAFYTSQGGPDTIKVQSNGAGSYPAIVTKTGDSVIFGNNGSLAGIQVEVDLTGSESPQILVDNSADQASHTVSIGNNGTGWDYISGLSQGPIYMRLAATAPVKIQAGQGADVFQVKNAPSVQMSIDGGASAASAAYNTLDYSAFAGDVTVNLKIGAATGLAHIANIQNVTGSIGNDILVGDANVNILRGGTGRNLIIGGGGADQIIGSGGDDLLIAGSTAYDTNQTALNAIRDEWISADTFDVRINNIRKGVTGGYYLSAKTTGGNPATVAEDGLAQLTGGPGRDWFFANPSEITDFSNDPTNGDRQS
jgi:hypothetical protein